VNDMYADAVLAIVLRVDTDPQARKVPVQRITKPDLYREFRDRLEVLTLSRCVLWACCTYESSPSFEPDVVCYVSVIPLQRRSCSVCMPFVRLGQYNG